MLKCLSADLHIHSCLSPCADLTMSPKRLVDMAVKKGLDVIAICDHNSAENIRAALKGARNTSLTVLPGMEITTVEEVHVIGLFPTYDAILGMQEKVYANLIPGENKDELFGEQIIANEFDEIEGYNHRLLIGATNLSIDAVVQQLHDLGALAIASHVDREAYSIIGQLGFIPQGLDLDALEISSMVTYDEAAERITQLADYPVVACSDAHSLEDIGKRTTKFRIEKPTIDEIRRAFQKKEGRNIVLEN
jgi:predicted metal-dependent phosphoesterase TrpH